MVESAKVADPVKVTILDKDLKIMWGLITTREWPVDMIPHLTHIKNIVSAALGSNDENKSTDES